MTAMDLSTPLAPEGSSRVSGNLSPFRYNRRAFFVTAAALSIIVLIGVIAAAVNSFSAKPSGGGDKGVASYNVGNVSLSGVKQNNLDVSEASRLNVNGELKVRNTLVLSPTTVPQAPVVGQIYYDAASNAPYYFNGTSFISLAPQATPQHVTSIGGAAGVLALGNGLQVNGSTLSVSSSLLQSITNVVNTPKVNSLQGQTGDVTLTAGNGVSINGTTITNSGVVSLTGSGGITVTDNGNGSWDISGAGGGGGGVTSLNGLAGSLNIANASGAGTTVTIDNASTAAKGIAQFNSTNFTVVAGLVNTVQNIATTSSPTFAGLTLTSALPVASGGTGQTTYSDGQLLIGNSATNGLTKATLTAGAGVTITNGNGSIQIDAPSAGSCGTCANVSLSNLSAVAINTSLLSGAATIDLGSGTSPFRDLYLGGTSTNNFRFTGTASAPRVLNIPDAGGTLAVSASGNIALSAAGNITFTGQLPVANGGTNASTAAGARSNLGAAASGANADITSLTALTSINPSSALTVGNTGQSLTLQGNSSSVWTATNGANTATVGFQAPTANVSYQFATAAAGTYSICTTAGNCTGVGGGVTTPGGTANQIAKFTGAQTLGDSNISDDGTTVSVQGTGGLFVGTAAVAGVLDLSDGSSNYTRIQAASTASNLTFTLPSTTGASGECIKNTGTPGVLTFGACLSGGGSGGGVTDINGTSGAITLAGTTNQITVTESPSGTFTFSTPQNIHTGASPTFNALTLTNALTVANGGTGANTLAANGILYGNGTSAIQATTAAANSVLVTDGSNVPSLSQTLPSAVQGNITSTGALTSGSIASGFGTISTANNITTTATVQGGALNATSAIQLGGTSINTAGTLSNVAYLNQANIFSAANTFTSTAAVQGGLTLGLASTTSGTLTFANSASSRTLTLQAANVTGTGNATLNIPALAGGSTDTVCLQTVANCTSGLSGSGTTNTIAMFTGATSLGDSALSQSGGNLTASGNLTVSGGSLTVGNPGTTAGSLILANATSSRTVILQGANPSGVGNATISIPSIAGGSSDTVCLLTLANCAGAGGGVTSAGGTSGRLAKFTGSTTIGNSILDESGNTITLQSGASTATITGSNALTVSSAAAQTLTLDSGTTGAVNIGTSANGKTVTVGNNAGATSVIIDCGTGNCSLGATATSHTTLVGSGTGTSGTQVQCGTGSCLLGATATDHTTTVGSSTGLSTTNINAGTNGLNIGTGGIANTIQIGNTVGAVAQTINIGNNATASSSTSIVIGNTVGGNITLQGSANINIGANAASQFITVGNGTSTTGVQILCGTGTCNFGANAIAHSIIIGNNTGTTGVSVLCGTGNCNFGASATDHTTALGSTLGTSVTNIQGGTGGINVGTGGIANTIQIGNTTGAVAQTINIGNNATASSSTAVNIGSAIGTSPVTIQSGTSGVLVKGANTVTAFQIQNASSSSILTVSSTTGVVLQQPFGGTYAGGTDVSGSTTGTGNSGETDVAINGRYAYITAFANATACSQSSGSAIGCELQVYDVSNPSSPTYVGGADASGSTNSGTGSINFNSIQISGHYAYVVTAADATACSQSAGSATGCEIKIFDISNPSAPTYVSGMDIGGSSSGTGSATVQKVKVYGRYLFLAKQGSATACSQSAGSAIGCELQAYDIANPTTPIYLGGADVTGSTNAGTGNLTANAIAVSGKYLYLGKVGDATGCSQSAGSAIGCELMVFDISNPASLSYVGGVDAAGASGGTGSNSITAVAVNGRYAYVTKSGDATACSSVASFAIGCEFMVFDVSRVAPSYVGGADASGSTNTGTGLVNMNTLVVSGRYVYTVSFADATACSQTAGSAVGCELKTFDVNTPSTPTYVGGVDASASTNSGTGSNWERGIALSGRYVYVTKSGDATACSQTAGSAIGCELTIFDVSGVEATSVQAHSLEAGILQVQTDAIVNNQLTVQGALAVGQNALIQGDLTVSGKALFANASNSTTAFQVQSSSGASLFQVDTVNSNVTIAGNNSAELQPWQTNSNVLPAERQGNVTVTANGYIYSLAGYDNGFNHQTTVYYAKLNSDGSTGSWSTNANSLPGGRTHGSAVYANGYVYMIGGTTASTAQSTVYYAKQYSDGHLGTFNTTTSLPAVRKTHASVTANGYVYVIGGFDSSTAQSTIYYAKLNSDGTVGSWSTNANALPSVLGNQPGAVVANGRLYVMGGHNGTSAQSAVYYATLNTDGSTSTWTTNGTSLPAGRQYGKSVVMNGYVYVIGGINNASALQSDAYYAKLNSNGSVGSWSTATNTLPAGRAMGGVATANGYVYYVGGGDGGVANTTVYYTSTPRLKVGASLDLLGLQGQTLADAGSAGIGSSGGSLTAGDGLFVGNLQVVGQSSLQGVAVNGTLSVYDSATIQTQTNTATAFQVQNASGQNLINIDTNASLVNIGATGATTVSSIIHIGDTTANNTQLITIGSFGNASSSVAIQAGSGGSIDIGSNIGSSATSVSIGSTVGASAVTIQSGTGAINIGTNAVAHSITLGNTTAATAITIQGGTGASAITLTQGSGGTITVGSTSGAAAVAIRSGTGNISLTTNGASASTIVKSGTNSTTAFQVQNASNASLFTVDTSATNGKITLGGDLVASTTATATTATTSGTGTNTTTLTFTGTTSFANGDVLFIDNAGQDYYTRIISGGTAASVTVDPAVTFENTRTVTKYTVQSIGSANNATNAPPNSERFFQGYFLGGIVTGAASTKLSDGNLSSTGNLTVATGTSGTLTLQSGTGGISASSTATTGTAQSIAANSLSTGNALQVTSTSASLTSGILTNISQTSTYTSGATVSGNILSGSRSITTNIGAITVDASPVYAQSNTSSVTQSYTVPASNRVMIVTLATNGNGFFACSIAGTVTYGGVSLTLATGTNDGVDSTCIYYLSNPTPGTANVVANSGAGVVGISISTWANVNTSSPIARSTTTTGSGAISNSISSSTNEVIIDSNSLACYSPVGTPGGGQTVMANNNPAMSSGSTYGHHASYKTGSAGSTTMTWSTSDCGWSNAIVALSPAIVTVSGAAASLSSNCTQTSGTCADSSNILSLTQSYASASGSVLKIQNAGTGNDLELGTGKVLSGAANGASAIGFKLNTASFTTAGAKLLSAQNNSVEKFSVDKDGNVNIASGAGYFINGANINTAGTLSNVAYLNQNNSFSYSGTNTFTSSSTGTALAIAASTTTGNAATVTANSLTSGSGLQVTSTSAALTSGNLTSISGTSTYAAVNTISGNLLNASRSLTSNISIPSVTFLGQSSVNTAVGGSSVSNTGVTTGSQSNRLLVAQIGIQTGGVACSSPTATYGAQSMTLLSSFTNGNAASYTYTLVAPNTGTATVTFNCNASPTVIAMTSSSFSNVNQTSPTSTPVTAGATSGSASNTVSSASNEIVMDTVGTSTNVTGTPGGGQNQLSTNSGLLASYKTGSASTSMTWSFSSVDWADVAFAIKPVSLAITVTGAAASISSNCTVTSGGCVDSSNILNLNQQYTSATGAVLTLQNAGSGAAIALTQTGASTIDIQLAQGTVQTAAGTTSTAINLGSGNASAGASGAATLQSGTGTSGTGTVTIKSGNASAGASGNVVIDTGTFTSGTPTIQIGVTNASAVSIGRSGQATTINGTLTVQQAVTFNSTLTVGTVTLNGHLITGNTSGSTTASPHANAGTSATCNVSGNDTGGQITLVTGSASWAAGIQCTITFANSFGAAPHPVIAPANSTDMSAVKAYVDANTTTMTINFINADTGANTYKFNYFNAQ